MILQALHELYGRFEQDEQYRIAPPDYSLQKITFKVVIDAEGKLVAIQDARLPAGKKPRPQMILVLGSGKSPGSGFDPCFLWDNAAYMLGFKKPDSDPTKAEHAGERAAKSFAAFRARHLEAEREIASPRFSAVCRFLTGWQPDCATNDPILAELDSGFGVFQIAGEMGYVHQEPAVKAWWAQRAPDNEVALIGQCLVSGERGELARLQPKIKGIDGAQTAGASLVSFNENAYESYGREQSYNAPVSRAAAFRYGTALNALLDGPMRSKHRFGLGDATIAFWTERPTCTEDIFAAFALGGSVAPERADPQDAPLLDKLAAFLRALRDGREAYASVDSDPYATAFYLLGLSPNAARVSVRFFHRGTLGELLDNLRRHSEDIRLERRYGEGSLKPDPEIPSLQMLLDETCPEKEHRPDRDKIPPILAGPLLQAIIGGGRYPYALIQAVVRRIRADRDADNYVRCCMIKGYLTRNLNMEVSMSLDPDRTEPAYRMGRLFAALEKTQKDALGMEINATIRDRFYSAASATPRSVFPRLLRTYQHHLAKLEGGYKVNREKLVQEILAPMTGFPAHLGLAEQGLFAIGYYHQTRDFYRKTDEQPGDVKAA